MQRYETQLKTKHMKKKKDYTLLLMLIVLLSAILASCGVTKGGCSGNKAMAYYGGYSRKAFTK
jgi:predicted small secreted protein